MKRPDVTIGIPTYKGGQNVITLVKSLLAQTKRNYTLRNIFVYSDASPDDTIEKLRKIKHVSLNFIVAKKRKGFGAAVKHLLNKNISTIVVLLNDDIVIKSKNYIDSLIFPFLKNKRIDLLGGKIMPLAPKTFIEKSAVFNFKVFLRMRNSIKNRHNKYTFDGKVMVLTRSFTKKLKFPTNLANMGNVDSFLYFSCIKTHSSYYFNAKAVAYFRFPSTLKDHLTWSLRNTSNSLVMRRMYKELASKAYEMPKKYYTYFSVSDIIFNIPYFLVIIITHLYVQLNKRQYLKKNSSVWEVITSTKEIDDRSLAVKHY